MRCLHFVIPLAVALGASVAPLPAAAQIGLALSVSIAPPPLPVYEQPPLPAPGYIFTPGYWSYGDDGYFWVPGTWVEPPQPGLLWTPGYWGWNGGHYLFNAGYWGATVGFYGGINYGFGYGGEGFEGGYWRGGSFFYNSRVNNFGGVHVTNVFERNVTHVTVNRVSFNGPGGIDRRPSPQEQAAMHESHIAATEGQTRQFAAARQNRALLATVNHGRPAITATARPGEFGGAHPAAARAGSAAHPNAVSPHPVSRMQAPHGAGMAQPHPVTRDAAPRQGMAQPHPVGREAAPREAAPRQGMAQPQPMAREAAPRESMARPQGGMAPHPAAAPRPAPAPRPAGRPAGHEDDKKHG
jgi:hypothetical protein